MAVNCWDVSAISPSLPRGLFKRKKLANPIYNPDPNYKLKSSASFSCLRSCSYGVMSRGRCTEGQMSRSLLLSPFCGFSGEIVRNLTYTDLTFNTQHPTIIYMITWPYLFPWCNVAKETKLVGTLQKKIHGGPKCDHFKVSPTLYIKN